MVTGSGNESEGSISALFDKGARLFDNVGSPMEQTPPGAGKMPTTPSRVVDLAAAVQCRWGQWDTVHLQSVQPGLTCIFYFCKTSFSHICEWI